ncbi:DNA endonuclease [Bacillus sp. J33]|uniref:DNA endonuclease n=1 Tax=Bacillus sp. J33 TaxID=935836 RepID=UPI0004B45F03|nr:DNA endonuclease [Bacillus sp. J33]
MNFENLTLVQQNILFASIMADGEITKCYPGSRRKNNSYREHFGEHQRDYRKWKASFYEGQLYIRPNNNYLVSKSDPYFTQLYPHFYENSGNKKIPEKLLPYCSLPHFLTVLYLDDGSLCITKRINHHKKLIYLTPSIFLYLQNYPREQLLILKAHIYNRFGFDFNISRRKDGYGYILKLTTIKASLEFLAVVNEIASDCIQMDYKYNWEKRLQLEKEKIKNIYTSYQIQSSDSSRYKNYSENEIAELIHLKKNGKTDNQIAIELQRSYWSVVYKLRELRKDGFL